MLQALLDLLVFVIAPNENIHQKIITSNHFHWVKKASWLYLAIVFSGIWWANHKSLKDIVFYLLLFLFLWCLIFMPIFISYYKFRK